MGKKQGLQPKGDLQLLEEQLTAARREEPAGELVALLEKQLAKVRHEQRYLIEQLAHQHGGTLFELASRLAGADARDDIAQEAFLSLSGWVTKAPLAKAKALFAEPNNLRRLMFRITVCRAYDFWRKRKELPSQDAAQCMGIADSAPMQDPRRHLGIGRLQKAYAELRPPQRIVHVLHHYYGFTDADIEQTLGIPKATARVLIHRANIALGRAMGTRI